MIVRPLTPGDYAKWSAMRQRLWPEEGRDDVADLGRMHVPFTVLVADVDGTLIGFAEASIRSVVDGLYFAPAAFLEGIWVDPEQRRKGVAATLLDAVKHWAQAQGVAGVGSDVLLGNVESLAWHRRMGFIEESQVVKLVLELT